MPGMPAQERNVSDEKPAEMAASAETVDDNDDEQEETAQELPAAVKLTLKKLRDELKATKLAAKQASEREAQAARKLQEKADAELSETERLRKQVDDLKAASVKAAQEAQRVRDEQAIERAAVEQHAHKPSVIVRLIDHDAIERDADGKPSNVGQLVKELLKENPYLKGDATTGPPGTPRPNTSEPNYADKVREAQEKLAQTGLYPRF
jgi:hypothetical protein